MAGLSTQNRSRPNTKGSIKIDDNLETVGLNNQRIFDIEQLKVSLEIWTLHVGLGRECFKRPICMVLIHQSLIP